MRGLIAVEKGESFKEELDEPPPLHHEVNYAIRTWLDHRAHGSYPNPGGYNKQDPLLMADFHTLTLYHIRVENGVVSHVQMPAKGQDSETLMMD